MMERTAFLDLLRTVVDQAKINDNKISVAEIEELFEDEDLGKEQMEMVYDYLGQSNITVEGYKKKKSTAAGVTGTTGSSKNGNSKKNTLKEGSASESGTDEASAGNDSKILKMYLNSLKAHAKLAEAEEREIIRKLISGDFLPEFYEEYISRKLHFVVSRARRLAMEGEVLEELIQEGNIGLLTAMGRITAGEFEETEEEITRALEAVKDHVDKAMQDYIDSIYESESEEKAMVAKVNFVSEAAKQLKEENGVEPSLKEMAAYTNMDEEELMNIINLSADNLKANDKQ